MKLALILHSSRPSALAAATALVAEAARRGMHVAAAPADAARLPGSSPWEGEKPAAADVVVAVGGDGTMLEAARLARSLGADVVGINVGTVGFLTEVNPLGVADMLDRLVAGGYAVSERMTLRATMPDGRESDALNDVVTEKAMAQHVVGLSVTVDGEPLAEYRADAVIVATPTGSTAYTYSAGGPLVDPEVDSLVVTPVAPHNVLGRAMVFGPETTVLVTVVGDRPATVHADGSVIGALDPGEGIAVRRGPHRDRIVRLDPSSFTSTVAGKLMSSK